MSDIDDEIQGLQSFYYQPGELTVLDYGNGKQLTVNIRQNRNDDKVVKMKVDIRIPEGYPDSIPDILLDCADLSRDNLTTIRQEADKVTKQYIGDPMLLVVLNCIQEKFDEAVIIIKCDDSIKESHQSVDVWNTLLKLDHMRAKSKYIKTIEKWTQELNLKGRVVFCGKLILIVLQGSHANIKGYIVRQKSVNVDVDSHGRSCKEKMMSVLCEEPATGPFSYCCDTVLKEQESHTHDTTHHAEAATKFQIIPIIGFLSFR